MYELTDGTQLALGIVWPNVESRLPQRDNAVLREEEPWKWEGWNNAL